MSAQLFAKAKLEHPSRWRQGELTPTEDLFTVEGHFAPKVILSLVEKLQQLLSLRAVKRATRERRNIKVGSVSSDFRAELFEPEMFTVFLSPRTTGSKTMQQVKVVKCLQHQVRYR